jgi:ribosomal protein S27AE
MIGLENEQICPKCGSHRLKAWHDLTADEKFLAERLPLSTEYTAAERKKHRFCTRCWFEEVEHQSRIV